MAVLRVFWSSVKAVWEELFMLALMNLVTALLLVPIVTFPPALAGLWYVSNIVAQGRSIAWSDYFEAFKRYFGRSWALAGINIAVIVTLVLNILFYRPGVPPLNLGETASLMIRAFWTSLLVIWVFLQMYPLALLLEQDDQRVRLALRNSLILLAAHPGFSLVLGIILLVVLAVSTVIPALLALISMAVVGVTCNMAVRHLLVPYRDRLREEEEEAAAETDLEQADGIEPVDPLEVDGSEGAGASS
jgi:uncharacterized membrane protein YesL